MLPDVSFTGFTHSSDEMNPGGKVRFRPTPGGQRPSTVVVSSIKQLPGVIDFTAEMILRMSGDATDGQHDPLSQQYLE
jgi:hypothetical protein